MTFVMKRPLGRSKGIVIFTHKELRFVIGEAPAGPLGKALARLRERYVIGVHWGHYADDVVSPGWVDFHLAAPGTVRFRDPGSVRHIPLSSRNFLGAEFRDLGLPRVWDVVNIVRPIKLKGVEDFLQVVRRVYDRNERLRVLLVCPCPDEMTESEGWYSDIYADYVRLFSPSERSDFVLLLLRGDGYPFPLASGAVAHLLNTGKTFALFSEQEGESRAVAEALLCGLVVVCREGIRGGAADHLDDDNSRQFVTLEDAADAFVEAAAGWDENRFDTRDLEIELLEQYTRPRLVRALEDVFASLAVPFDGELDLDDLARQLPSHVLTLPEELRMPVTNDLNSPRSVVTWIGSELGQPVRRTDLLLLSAHARIADWRRRRPGQLAYRLARALRRRLRENPSAA